VSRPYSLLQQKSFFVSPPFLGTHGISFQCFMLQQGDMMFLKSQVAHEGFNLGQNVTIAKNFLCREDLATIFVSARPCTCQNTETPVTNTAFENCRCHRHVPSRFDTCPDANYVVDLRGVVKAVMDPEHYEMYMATSLRLPEHGTAAPPCVSERLSPSEEAIVEAFQVHLQGASANSILKEFKSFRGRSKTICSCRLNFDVVFLTCCIFILFVAAPKLGSNRSAWQTRTNKLTLRF
jgi:JmjC domain, hydroxylase